MSPARWSSGGLLVVAVWWLNLRGAGLLVLIFVLARVMPRVVALQNAAQIIVGGLPWFDAVQRLIDSAEAHQEPVAAEPKQLPHGSDIQPLRCVFQLRRRLHRGAPSRLTPHPRRTHHCHRRRIGSGEVDSGGYSDRPARPGSGPGAGRRPTAGAGRLAGWRRSVWLRSQQDGFLLDDTIRANFLWAVPEATEAQMWQALSRAAAADFVRSRPEGLATTVGDRGIGL